MLSESWNETELNFEWAPIYSENVGRRQGRVLPFILLKSSVPGKWVSPILQRPSPWQQTSNHLLQISKLLTCILSKFVFLSQNLLVLLQSFFNFLELDRHNLDYQVQVLNVKLIFRLGGRKSNDRSLLLDLQRTKLRICRTLEPRDLSSLGVSME